VPCAAIRQSASASKRKGWDDQGVPRDPEAMFGLREHDRRQRVGAPPGSAHAAAQRILAAVEAAENALMRSHAPATVEPYPLFLFDRRRRE
jgi:hypothetical protein